MNLMVNCHEAGRLLSERMDRTLTVSERGKLWFHLSMCKMCTKVKRQFHLIRQAARRLGKVRPDVPGLSPEAKLRIVNRLTRTPD